MVQIGVAGEYVGLADFLGTLAGLQVEPEAFSLRKYVFLQNTAVIGGFAIGKQQRAILINELNGDSGERLEGFQHLLQPLRRNKRIDSA